MRSQLSSITFGLILAASAPALYAQGTATDRDDTTGSNQPTVTTDDTRGGATGTTSDLATSAQTEPALEEDQFNRGNSEESNDTGNWGLLGLLGLAGLMGRKRDRDATVVRRDVPAR